MLTDGDNTRCHKAKCAAGYNCDYNSSTISPKVSMIQYTMDGESTACEFHCSQGQVSVSRNVVGKTTDFHVVAYQGFHLSVCKTLFGSARCRTERPCAARRSGSRPP